MTNAAGRASRVCAVHRALALPPKPVMEEDVEAKEAYKRVVEEAEEAYKRALEVSELKEVAWPVLGAGRIGRSVGRRAPA